MLNKNFWMVRTTERGYPFEDFREKSLISIENFEPIFNKQLENLFIERMDGNEEIFLRLMTDEEFRNVAASHLMRVVYQQIQTSGKNGG